MLPGSARRRMGESKRRRELAARKVEEMPTGAIAVTIGGMNYPGWTKRPEEMTPAELRARVLTLEESLRQVEDEPGGLGVVVDECGKTVVVQVGPQSVSVGKPGHLDVGVGSVVRVNGKGQILAVFDPPPAFGNVLRVVRIVDEKRVIVAAAQAGVERTAFYRGEPPAEGEEVLLDQSGIVVVRRLGKPPAKMVFSEETGVSWDDVGGQEAAKRELREAIEGATVHAEVYRRFGGSPTKGILLWGKPGNGKTMLGKAAATALASLRGKSARSGGFVYVKGPELLNMFVGASEGNVRAVFAAAREHRKAHGYPPIVFVDEADAILGKRGERRGVEGMERTIVPQFLAEMDGLDACDALLILATNRPDALDPAVVRDGRCDLKIEVRPPSREDAAAIVAKVLRKAPLFEPADGLGEAAASAIFEDREPLYVVRCAEPKHDRRVALGDFVSGALCAGVAERAIRLARRRAIAGIEPASVTRGDLAAAAADAREAIRGTDHEAELRAIVDEMPVGVRVQGIERVASKAARKDALQ